MKKYTETQIEQALQMKADGASFKTIAKATKMKAGSINYYVQRALKPDTTFTESHMTHPIVNDYGPNQPHTSRFNFILTLPIPSDDKITLLRWLQA